MKSAILVPALCLLPWAGAAMAQTAASAPAAPGSCEAVAAEISARIRANGVNDFVLEVVPNRLAEGEKVVGSCDRGSRKIIYLRTAGAPKAPTARP